MPPDAKDIVLRHHNEVWSKGDLAAVDELYSPDFVGHHPGQPDWIGRESVKLAVRRVREAFPDFTERVDDVVSEGSKVVTRFTASGTHLGAIRGIAPTRKRLEMSEMGVFRVSAGQIVEKWGLLDRLGMFQDLGVVPRAWPLMEFLYDIAMDVERRDLGTTPSGQRRIVSVKGGTFEGPRLKGRVLPGGGDWLIGRPDGSSRLDVRITLEVDDGALIYASYGGLFHAAPDVIGRIAAGETVDADDYYFRTAPLFETSAPEYDWLNRVLAVGYGRRTQTQVLYSVYALL